MAAPSIVETYAQLLDQRDAAAALGRPPPPGVVEQIQALYHRAQQLPIEARSALDQHVRHLRGVSAQNRLQAQQAGQEALEQRALAAELRNATATLTTGPLDDPADIARIAAGESIKRKTGAVRLDEDALERHVQETHGTTVDRRLEMLDHVVDAGGADTERGRALMERYKVSPEAAADHAEHGLQFEMHRRLARAQRDDPDEIEVKPDESDSIRASLIAATAEHDRNVADNGASPYLELPAGDTRDDSPDAPADSLARDLAAAWDAVEHRDLNEEIRNGQS